MMGITQPDVTFSEQVVPGQSNLIASAVPLFIGYTATGPSYALYPINSFPDFESEFGTNSAGILSYAVMHYFDNGGSGGFALSLGSDESLAALDAGDLVTAFSDSRIQQAIAGESTITLVAIPDMQSLPDEDTVHWVSAWNALLAICQTRRGVFGLFDTPDSAQNASRCLSSFVSSSPANPEWGAAYWPRLLTNYTRSEQNQTAQVVVPPSAALAAVIELTDQQSGVWKAPANVTLAQVVKPTQSWMQSAGLFNLNGASLNLIRSFPGRGTRVWGCRTLTDDTESPWLYVQIRRLVAYIETQVSGIGRNFIFESNNMLTWIKFRGLVHIWLRQIWLDGGLYGEEEQEAFYIQIGLNETMTQDDIDNGKMIMKVGVAVAYPAEFINISLEFDTSVGSVQPPASMAGGL